MCYNCQCLGKTGAFFANIQRSSYGRSFSLDKRTGKRKVAALWLTTMTKRIPLTQGQYALIDDEDFELVSQYKWYALYNSRTHSFYARTAIPHPEGGKIEDGTHRRTTLSMARLILGLGFYDTRLADHVNHDTLDNRRGNLRTATRSENSQNIRKSRANTSGYTGVWWNKRRKRWVAKIGANNRTMHLGFFTDPVEAAKAYDRAALEFHGEFATTNFIHDEKEA